MEVLAHLELAVAVSIPPENLPTNKGTAADPDAWHEIFSSEPNTEPIRTGQQPDKTKSLKQPTG